MTADEIHSQLGSRCEIDRIRGRDDGDREERGFRRSRLVPRVAEDESQIYSHVRRADPRRFPATRPRRWSRSCTGAVHVAYPSRSGDGGGDPGLSSRPPATHCVTGTPDGKRPGSRRGRHFERSRGASLIDDEGDRFTTKASPVAPTMPCSPCSSISGACRSSAFMGLASMRTSKAGPCANNSKEVGFYQDPVRPAVYTRTLPRRTAGGRHQLQQG